MTRRRAGVVGLAFLISLTLAWAAPAGAQQSLPSRLSDAEFWALSAELSEPNGYFRTDNLLSNELRYPEVLDALIERVKPGGVYLGVGPEQNFNYIAALKPRMAFITDVRRGNLHMHLMYKALFELSADRSEFVSRLFTKPRQPLPASATAADLMNAYWDVPTSAKDVFDRNFREIADHLTKRRSLPLPADDIEGIEAVYYAFYWYGPSITYSSSQGGGRGGSMATYAQLMVAADATGATRSYLASEQTFRVVKELESRNLIVPVVGNFGGPKALRAVGRYVRERGATVSAFYLSNVEQYLRQDNLLGTFCGNVASMPLDEGSTFIRSQSGVRGFGGGGGFMNSLASMLAETAECVVPMGAGGGVR